jgi:hypothetical protein
MWWLREKEGVKRNPKRFGWVGMTWLVLPVLLVLTTVAHVHGETAPTKKWAMRWNGSLSSADGFSAEYSAALSLMFMFYVVPVEPNLKLMAVDGNGYVYITGSTLTNNAYDIVTMKINKANGKILWKMIFDGGQSVSEFPAGIALDSNGDVYVTGVTGTQNVTSDIVTIKYTGSNGAKEWDIKYKGSSNYLDGATGIAVDSKKNVYVCGFTGYKEKLTGIPMFNYLTLKYNGIGEFQWANIYQAPKNSLNVATAITVGPGNNVYVTGVTASLQNSSDILTIKYSPAGKELWKKTYDGPAHMSDVGRAIAVDASKNVYIAGESSIDGIQALVTLKYDDVATNPNTVWAKHYKDPKGNNFFSFARAMVLDAKGAPHVTGDVDGNSGYDYLTIKYNPNTGKQIWAKTYSGPATAGNDQVRSIALDSIGNAYVTGSSKGSSDNENDFDIATVKHAAANGAKCWAVRYNNKAAKDFDGGVAVAVYDNEADNTVSVYVAGDSMGTDTNSDIVVIRYDQAPPP